MVTADDLIRLLTRMNRILMVTVLVTTAVNLYIIISFRAELDACQAECK